MQIRSYGGGINTSDEPSPGGMHPSNISEILYLIDGEARLHWSGNQCKVKGPSIFLIGPDTPHQLENLGQPVSYFFIELMNADESLFNPHDVKLWNFMESAHGKLLMEENNSSDRKDPIPVFKSMIYAAIDFVYSMYNSGKAKEFSTLLQICELEINKILLLIHHIMEIKQGEEGYGNRPKKWSIEEAVNATIAFLDWRYMEDITLKVLADRVSINPSYLIRVFKGVMNRTPFQYLLELRLKAAANYLASSDMPIRNIAEATGFNSIHYFGRQFKVKFGYSPASWRKKMRESV